MTHVVPVPTSFAAGYESARDIDAEFADRYVSHTLIGDAPADDAVAELAEVCTPAEVHGMIARALQNHRHPAEDVPESLRSLVEGLADVPEWFDPGSCDTDVRQHRLGP